MKKWWALSWKTVREMRWLLIGGWLLFLLPTLSDIKSHYPHSIRSDVFLPSMMVMFLGGTFSMLVAIVVSVRDLREPVLGFWASRPIGAARFLTIKFCYGYIACLVILMTPLLIEELAQQMADRRLYHRAMSEPGVGLANAFALVLMLTLGVYSTAFAIGALVRRTVTAILLALGAGLFLYFAPFVIPELGFMNVFKNLGAIGRPNDLRILQEGNVIAFQYGGQWLVISHAWLWCFLTHVVLSAGALLLAILAVRRNWVLELNRRNVCWGVTLIGLFLLWSASRQIGSSLPVEKILPVDGDFTVCVSAWENGEGILGLASYPRQRRSAHEERNIGVTFNRFNLNRPPEIGSPFYHLAYPENSFYGSDAGNPVFLLRSKSRPESIYLLADQYKAVTERSDFGLSTRFDLVHLALVTLDTEQPEGRSVLHELDLSPYLQLETGAPKSKHVIRLGLFLAGDRLRVLGTLPDFPFLCLSLDVSVPAQPRFVDVHTSNVGWRLDPQSEGPDREGRYRVLLPEVPGLSPQEELRAMAVLQRPYDSDYAVLEGDLLAVRNRFRKEIRTFRVLGFDRPTSNSQSARETERWEARVELLDVYPLPPLMDRATGAMALLDGVLYEVNHFFNQGIVAYDLRDPRNIRRIGHYSAPDDPSLGIVTPLPGRRLLAAGRKLHLLSLADDK